MIFTIICLFYKKPVLLLLIFNRIESVARYEISESDIDELVPDLSRLFLEIG